jgi:hypothetical protein
MTEVTNFRTTIEERTSAIINESKTLMESIRFDSLPPLVVAEELAVKIRGNFSLNATSIIIAESLVEQNNWRLSYRRMTYSPKKSPINALLMPTKQDHQFAFVIDSDCLKTIRADDIAAWLIAHELGHTFLFDRTVRPPRPTIRLPLLPSGEDQVTASKIEHFCDHFSLHLTGFENIQ